MLPTVTLIQGMYVATGVAVLTALLGFIDIAAEGWANSIDIRVGKAVVAHRTRHETSIMRTASWFGGPYGILLAVSLFIVWRLQDKHMQDALLFTYATLFTVLYVLVVKLITARKRPTLKVIEIERTYSFPSAHTLISTFVYGVLAGTLMGNGQAGSWILVAYFSLIALIGLSRIYLGCHYLSDVLGGALGGAVLAQLFLLIR